MRSNGEVRHILSEGSELGDEFDVHSRTLSRWFQVVSIETVPKFKALMRAAGYGKSFLADYDSDEFVECCRKLRVLNNCRKSAGMPITSQQYDRLTPEVRWITEIRSLVVAP